jgi:Glycosyl hydrolase catalytic core
VAALVLALALALALVWAPPAPASPGLRGGITDSGAAYFAEPQSFYPALEELGVSVLRVHLNWGGKLGVAKRRPFDGTDPDDRAYDWRLYDRIVLQAERHGVEVLFSIFGTPPWANGGGVPTRAPRSGDPLREFAYAAASRYSGTYVRGDGTVLPRVRYWTAWNEPNLQIGLVPQWRRVGRSWVIQSAIDYARICNAVVEGIRSTMLRGRKVACGVTAARGNNNPNGGKPSVSPLAFLRAMKKAGATGFDAYAHHPYYGAPSETPATPSPGRGGVTLGNIDALVSELTRLYGPKRIWLTEYGYQTNPPDNVFGVSWATQARYVRESFAIARAHPRIDMLLWFLLQDEGDPARWQSGLISAAGKKKPAFAAFREALAELRR